MVIMVYWLTHLIDLKGRFESASNSSIERNLVRFANESDLVATILILDVHSDIYNSDYCNQSS